MLGVECCNDDGDCVGVIYPPIGPKNGGWCNPSNPCQSGNCVIGSCCNERNCALISF